MASYSRSVKNELAHVFDEDDDCLRAELAAILKVGAIFNAGRLEFSTRDAAIARKVITLLKKFYPDAKKEVAAVRTKRFAWTMRYNVRIFLTGYTEEFFEKLASPEITPDDFTKVAYLRGAFLAGGTVNKPEKQYYLDISTLSESAAVFVHELLVQLDFYPKFYRRKEFFANYICEGDAITEFLGMVGAEESVEHFEVTRNLKEVRANVNRLVNCETANLNKMVETAQRQLADIRFIFENKIEVNEDLKIAIAARQTYPECSLAELSEKLFITRQGLCYRFKKIHEIVMQFKSEQQQEIKS